MPEKSAQIAVPISSSDPILESHENRIIRLESDIQDLAATSAASAQKLESLSTLVSTGIANISEKIDNCVAPLSERLKEHIAEDLKVVSKIDNLAESVSGQGDKIVALESIQEKKVQRLATIKKVLGALTLAAAGAIVKEIIMLFFK